MSVPQQLAVAAVFSVAVRFAPAGVWSKAATRGAVGWSSATESRARSGQGWSYVPSHSHEPEGVGSRGNSTYAASTPGHRHPSIGQVRP